MVEYIVQNHLAAQNKFVFLANEVNEVNPFHFQVGLHSPSETFRGHMQ